MFYLDPEDWSPRFEATFFTVKWGSHSVLDSSPSSEKRAIGGRTNHPAVYYEIELLCGHKRRVCLRRYSQFRWLYDRVAAAPPTPPPPTEGGEGAASAAQPPEKPLGMPPKTCLFHNPRDEEFLDSRQEELLVFLRDLLRRPGYADHPAVVAFLELDEITVSGDTQEKGETE